MTGASWLARGVHILAVILAAMALSASLFYIAGTVSLWVENAEDTVSWIFLLLPWVLGVAAVGAIWKKLSYKAVLPVFGLCGGFVLYLFWDDWSRPPAPEFGPVIHGDSPSYTAYRWLLKDDPHSRLNEAEGKKDLPPFPAEADQWNTFVTQHRDAFERAWAEDALGRSWVEAMAANSPEGLFPPQGTDGVWPSFMVIRRHCMARWGKSQLLLVEGENEEAVRLLLPLLRASYHLQRGGNALVTEMIAIVCLRGTYSRLEHMLKTSALSATSKTEIVRVLEEAPPIQLCIKNAFKGEHYVARSSADLMNHGTTELRKNLTSLALSDDSIQSTAVLDGRFLYLLFFNPNRSEREYSDFLNEVCQLVQDRKLDTTDPALQRLESNMTSWHPKNQLGRKLMTMAMPAFKKIFVIFWETEDRRLALLQRLQP
jgi:hypothetical protein